MILVATGETSDWAFQQAIVFASQLRAAGFDPVLDGQNVSEEIGLSTRFAAMPYLRDLDGLQLSHVIVIGAQMDDQTSLASLRRLSLDDGTKVLGFGHFETPQNEISATARLTYLTGRQPVMTDLTSLPHISAGKSICPCFGVDVKTVATPHLRGLPSVTLIAPNLEQPDAARSMQALTTTHAFKTLTYMTGKDKSDWIRQFGPGGDFFGFSELGPTQLSSMSDVLILTGPIGNNHNALCLLNNHTLSGSAIIDASPDGEFEQAGYPVHRGPINLGYMSHFLRETILPNMEGIREAAKSSRLAAAISMENVFEEEPPRRKAPAKRRSQKKSVHFMPTNGNGLGHAQRCVLIAFELKAQKTKASFFAFPSCLPMINKAGFEATPLIPRSSLHSEGGANDLANYPRLHAQMADNDVFVFDGGYVFEGLYRTIVERKLSSVWIRRGLWSSAQDNRVPLDREKYFARVIEPMEAFETLNRSISSGSHVRQIGPIVRQVKATPKSRKALFAALQKQFGVSFDKLVITMLGSGMLHNLSANVQTVCNALERREDCLNLIVVWPSAVVPSERYAWQRSKVVKTTQASWLAAHADFVVSATGYNSFHEAMYNCVPAIFVPQNAQVLDDQSARAEAAADLGLAAHVPAGKLSQLDREMRRFLDEGKAQEIQSALRAHQFPEPGNAKAADLIKEMMG